MPVKKKAKTAPKKKAGKAAKKAAAKPKVKKSKVKKAAKKSPKKPVKKSLPGRTKPGKASGKPTVKPVLVETLPPAPEPPAPSLPEAPPPPPKKKLGIDCEHCDATGICAAGTPYDPSHGQMFGAKTRMTSCPECLEAAGEHSNSKKLVMCRICDGDGKI